MTTTPDLFAEKRYSLRPAAVISPSALQAGWGPDPRHVWALADMGAISFEALAPPMLTERMQDLMTVLKEVRDAGGLAVCRWETTASPGADRA